MPIKTETIEESGRSYLPAAGHDLFLPLYDPFVKLLGGDRVRRTLLNQATIRAADRILDVGCGTGSLVVLIRRLHPDVQIIGLDPDPKALARARHKAERAGISIQLDQGYSDALPYPEAFFDRVFSSLMFHHVQEDAKGKTLREIRRVLKPGGFFHMLDFGGPESGDRFLTRLIHSGHRLKDNAEDRILSLLRSAEFRDPKIVSHGKMLFFRVVYYSASIPAS
jgi:ubiquinone/menaquinone biosynthesis C-methylase UbiE